MGVEQHYLDLCDYLRELDDLEGIEGLLSWDELVMMPEGGADARAQQKATLAAVLHRKTVAPTLEKLLSAAESMEVLNKIDAYGKANVRDARRNYDLATAKSEDLIKREAILSSQGYQAWHKARSSSDFSQFAPMLGDLISLRREIASVSGYDEPYDFLIDTFERGMTERRLTPVFDTVKSGLQPLLKEIMAAGPIDVHPALKPPEGGWDIAAQEALCTEVSAGLGFDFERGRFDTSVHPFTGGSDPTDTRITTRYLPDNFLSSLMATVHETGHAIYEQQRNSEQNRLPVSQAVSMGIHESQSLLFERMVGQSRGFWKWVTPIVHKHLPSTMDAEPEDFYRAVNLVKPGFIRVNADEVTYPLHIILRFELERDIFAGRVKVEDLPSLWNQKMQDLLGITPPDDSKGVLQDVHWSDGSFGYFPSYTLGAMYAVQFYQKAVEAVPTMDEQIAQGNFKALRDFLREHIHKYGSLNPSAEETCKQATAKVLDPQLFLNYLRKKYSELYDLKGRTSL